MKDLTCPKCGSQNVSGLVAAFWVGLQEDRSPEEPLSQAVQSETEIGPERQCRVCDHEWEDEW